MTSRSLSFTMVKHNLSACFFSFLIITTYICICSCACDPPPELSPAGVDDYIENISAHYKNEIQIVESQLNQMELAFNKQLAIVAYSQDLAAKIARQLESRMRSTATLNMKGRLCIQHFFANVTSEHLNLQNKLRGCVDTARANGKTVGDSAKTQIRNSRAQLNDLMNDKNHCKTHNANNIQKVTDCTREKLKAREINMQNMMKAANKEIEINICRADNTARIGQECSFQVILETQTLLSEIVSNINTCIGDRILEIK